MKAVGDFIIIKEALGEQLNKYRSHNCSDLGKKNVGNNMSTDLI